MATLVASRAAVAGPLHFRAREHYETVTVSTADERATFRGFTNTIDFFYEARRSFSVGLAGSPLFATLRSREALPGFGGTIRLVHLGAEAKAFPSAKVPVFGRVGLFRTTLNPRGDAGVRDGRSGLLGIGYELELGGVTLAPEMSWRRGRLDGDLDVSGQAPAIGVHFYEAI